MKTLAIVMTGILVGMLTLNFAPSASASDSCTVFGTGSCTFTCAAGDLIEAGAAGPETVSGSCGGVTVGCAAPTANSRCFDNPGVAALFSDTGTCYGTGSGTATCESHTP